MPLLAAKGSEPIPGYQLQERLGTGGYGEVWRTTAPGGLSKAMKIVFGDRTGPQAEQELKALERIKKVRHPFLLSLERFEIIEGHLIIVMELADASLLDRFEECLKTNLPGIPRPELLGYLRDAAEALDYMNEAHGLQHLDIKPQNLLLVGGRIKVADFGLVKDLSGTSVTATGGVTPVYATPEAFDGRVSRFSDQYSLAIVYQEMLTSVRPFTGTTALQLATQHTSGKPLLDPLPPGDRPTILRALAKVPELRFANCREMLEALLRPIDATPPPVAAPVSPPADLDSLGMRTEVGATPGQGVSTPVAQRRPARKEPTLSARSMPRALLAGKTGLRPTLFLGIGGIAAAGLRRLKQRLHSHFGNQAVPSLLRVLLVDTDRATLREAQQGKPGEALTADETLLLPLHPPDHYRLRARNLLRWLERRWLYGIPRSLLTEGLRPLGRLALVDNAEALVGRLRDALSAVSSPEAKAAACEVTGLDLRDEVPRIFVLASIAGGTGSGMLPGVAFAVRQILADLRLPAQGLCGVLAYAASPKPTSRDLARVNAYATLSELNHWSRPGNTYPGDPDCGLAAFGPGQPPLEDCYLVDLGKGLTRPEVDAAAHVLADYLFVDAVGGSGFLDRFRQKTPAATPDSEDGLALRSFGLSRIAFPRNRLADLAAGLFCQRLVERWPGKLTDADRKQLEDEAQRQAASLDLGEEPALPQTVANLLAAALGQSPNSYFQKMVAGDPVGADQAAAPDRVGQFVGRALRQIDGVLGNAPATPDAPTVAVPDLQTALHDRVRKLGAGRARQLVAWLVCLVENPAYRLKAADGASQWFARHLAQRAEAIASQGARVQKAEQALRTRLAALDSAGKDCPGRGPRKANPTPAGEALRSLREYWQLRFDELVLEHALTVVRMLSKAVATFQQDLTLAGPRLTQLAEAFREQVAAAKDAASRPGSAPHHIELLPGGAANLLAAATVLLNRLGPDTVRQFDENFQKEVLDPRGGLWARLQGNRQEVPAAAAWSAGSEMAALKHELEERARDTLAAVLQDIDAALLYLESRSEAEVENGLLLQEQAARPRLALPGSWSHLALLRPQGPAGTALEKVIKSVADVPVTVLESDGDVILCHEVAQVPLPETMESLIGPDANDYAALAQRVWSRTDVAWSTLSLAAR
jgi:hypothetical protein